MASSGHFDPSQIYDGYKEEEALDPSCTECLKRGGNVSNIIIPALQSAIIALLGRSLVNIQGLHFPISEVPISRINNQGVVKRIRRIANSPTDPDAEGSDELDGEEDEVVLNSVGHKSSISPSQTFSKIFQIQVIISTPRNFQQVLSTIPSSILPPSPNPSTSRPAMVSPVRPSPIAQPRHFPMVTPNNYNWWRVPVGEEKNNRLCNFLPPKYCSKGNIGLSELPERIQIWKILCQ
ncbi:hypothetical protein O181_021891 [Austropuccinia psidii MF-1]|uniref:Uncharacterized protein n=1 Tax=Austropuccinia psidii MF-1 TaxID=1389203 RepID=A0A9Q3CBU2_9BASI|nr:hypothetical protein [Austropuccinia psidii MF-1]